MVLHYRVCIYDVNRGLCSLGARRKSRFLVLGAEKKKKPPISHPPKPIFFLGRFSLGGTVFFLLGSPPPPLHYLNKYEVRGVSGYEIRCERPKKKIGARKKFWGLKKLFGRRTPYNEAAPKKKKNEVFPLGSRKIRLQGA